MGKAQQILYGLGGAVATLVLQMLAVGVGPLGVLVSLIVPLPACFAHMCGGFLSGGIAVVLSAVPLVWLGGESLALGYLLQFGLVSLVLPLLLKRGWAWDRAIAGTLLALGSCGAGALAWLAAGRQIGIGGLVASYVDGEVERAMEIYRQAEVSAEQLEELRKVAEGMAGFLIQAYPGVALAMAGVLLLFTVWALSALSRGRYIIGGAQFSSWKVPEALIWLVIFAGFALAFGQGITARIGLNLLTVLLPVYFLQGLAIVQHFFRRKEVSPMLQGLGYVLILFLNPLPLVLTAFGVFDMWLDFRKPRLKKT